MAILEQKRLFALAEGFVRNESRAMMLRFLNHAGQIAISASAEAIGENTSSGCR
jgi:hypothetical protein